MRRPQPLTLWAILIAVFVALLVLGGAFHRPVIFALAAVFAVAVIGGFFVGRRPR